MTFSEISLDALIERKESIETEIRSRATEELKELNARKKVLLGILGADEEVIDQTKECYDPLPKISIPKYQDPATGKTWSGKGKRPGWFDPERADDFLLKNVPAADDWLV